MTKREKMLAETAKIVTGERDGTYGGPEESFQAVAELWNAYLHFATKTPLSVELDADNVAIMMTLLKIARLATGGTNQADTWIDVAGYAACGYEIAVHDE